MFLLQAEQQLVDCAQNFNNHGCRGYVPDQGGETWSPFSFPGVTSVGSRMGRDSVLGGSKIGPT